MITAELSIQFTEDSPPKLYKAQRTDAKFDEEHWKRMEWMTPNSAGALAPPDVEWAFISSEATISVVPLADAKGVRICRIPTFTRAEIYPVAFGFPQRLAQVYAEEAEAYFQQVARREADAGNPPPDRESPFFQYALLRELWERHRTDEDEKRWLQKLKGAGHKLMMGKYYQGGIFDRDLNRIRFRTDFYTTGNLEPFSVLCASCEERLTSVVDAKSLPVPPLESANFSTIQLQPSQTKQVFNDAFTRATIPTGVGKTKFLALEPEQTRLVKRIAVEPGHAIARTKLVEERVAGTQPEKYFKRGALKELWNAKLIGKSKTGRLTSYWVRLVHD